MVSQICFPFNHWTYLIWYLGSLGIQTGHMSISLTLVRPSFSRYERTHMFWEPHCPAAIGLVQDSNGSVNRNSVVTRSLVMVANPLPCFGLRESQGFH